MNLINISQLAKKIGISRQAVHEAVKNNKISLYDTEKKLIDIDAPEIQEYVNTRNKKLSTTKKTIAKEIKKEKAISRGTKLNIKTPLPIPEQSQPILNQKQITSNPDIVTTINNNQLDYMTKEELDCIKIAEDIRLKRIKQAKDRGDLIDRYFVESLFNKIYSIDVNQFLQLKDSMTTKMGTIFDISDKKKLMEASEMINKELYKTQSHIKREIDEFLESMKKAATPDEQYTFK